jgi:cholinesterase
MPSHRLVSFTINMFCKLPLLALAAVTAAHPPSWGPGPAQHDELTVQTTSGSVHGKINSTYPNVRQFLGIPFAQPPLGDLRWAPPQPLSQPEAKVEAMEIGPSCIQYFNTNSSSVYRNQVLEYNLQGLNRTGDISEDCLKLSVWAPTWEKDHGKGHGWGGKSGKGKGLPVLVYFYGGGFSKCLLGA